MWDELERDERLNREAGGDWREVRDRASNERNRALAWERKRERKRIRTKTNMRKWQVAVRTIMWYHKYMREIREAYAPEGCVGKAAIARLKESAKKLNGG